MITNSHYENNSRTLIYIPIIHTQTDMGAMSEAVRKVTLQKLGEKAWNEKVRLVDQFWNDVELIINNMNLTYEKVRLYQDGLPICGREMDIVSELAAKGSHNHQILLNLIKKGGIIMGTEAPGLLIEEYMLLKKILDASNIQEAMKIEASQKTASEDILTRRDHFIAENIGRTLAASETGILFIGGLHRVRKLLAPDILIISPLKGSYKEKNKGKR